MGRTVGPVSLRYSLIMYNALEAQATEEPAANLAEFGYPQDIEGFHLKVFRGYIYDVATKAGLAHSAATQAMSILYVIEAATRLMRSNKSAPSVIVLNYKPTQEQLEEFFQRERQLTRVIAPSEKDRLNDEISALRARVTELEKSSETLNSKLAALEQKLANFRTTWLGTKHD